MVQEMMDFLSAADPEVGAAVCKEYERQNRNIELIASENVVSPAVLVAAGSVLTNKYAEGYPGKRYYGGCEYVDIVEEIARDRAKELFGAKFANVQPHSGAQANYAVYQALCELGDTVMGMNLDQGGHLTHGSPVNFSGKHYHMVAYGVDPVTHRIDYDQVRELAHKHKPKMIIAGASAYPRIIDFKAFADIAHEVGAYLMVDMAHIAGLVAAGLHPSPVPYADVVTTTTHKTLRGPRGGMILCNDEAIAKCELGDTVMGMNLDHGGHLTHGSPVNFSGKHYHMVAYGVDPVTHRIDYDQVRELAHKHKPKMIIAGASAYPRIIDFKAFADIAHEVGAYLMVDMAHIAGLVAAGLHPSPVPYADVVTTTTHKTLRGPRGGMILCNDEAIAKKINSAIFPGSQGGPLMHIIAAKAVALGEALRPEFKVYQQRILDNAQAMAGAILEGGLDLVSGGTDNHLMLVDLRPAHLTGKEMEKRLDDVFITANKNTIPNDPEKPFVTSGLRLGTPAATSRGLNEEDFRLVGRLICETAQHYDTKADEIRSQVVALTEKYPLYR